MIAKNVAAGTRCSRSEASSAVICQVAQNLKERMSAFGLVYDKYLSKGLIQPNEYRLRVTPYHLLPTTNVYIAKLGEQVICTVSLIGDGELGLPMETIYADEVRAAQDAGLSVGEVSCLATRGISKRTFLPVFLKLVRLMAQQARANGMDQFLISIHPRHAKFYERLMGFEQIGPVRQYPSVCNALAVPLCLDFARVDLERPPWYEAIFGERLEPEALRRVPISTMEVEFFRPASLLAKSCMLMMD
jgi:hypothetical protein